MSEASQVVGIILTRNQREDTLRCLESFRLLDYPRLELVLVDNHSNDGTAEQVQDTFPRVHLRRNPINAGAAGGRNIGIEYAKAHFAADFLLFIDNDTVVEKDFLEPLVAAIEPYPEAGLATPMVHRLGMPGIIDDAGGCKVNFLTGSSSRRVNGEVDRGQYNNCGTLDTVPAGPCMLVRRTAIEACGGFDPGFDPFGFEDLDLSLRIMAKGFHYRFVPASLVHHKGNRTGFKGYSPEYAAVKGRNLRRFVKRHATHSQWVCFNLFLPVLGVRTILREGLRGNFSAPFKLMRNYLRKP